MKLTTIGTGGPRSDSERNSTCVVVETGGTVLLFDAGRGAVSGLARAGIALEAASPLFITHHHIDHIGELAEIIILGWIQGRSAVLPIFGPPETASIVDTLLTRVYDKDILFRTTGERLRGDFVSAAVTEVRSGLVHDGGHYQVYAEEVRHGHGLPYPAPFLERWVCLGYRIEAEGKALSISGDTVRCPGVLHLARGADLHLQCCYMPAAAIDTEALASIAEHTLACSDTAGKIAAEAGARRLVLTHFRPMDAASLALIESDVRRDFAGELHLARDLDQFVV